ncbi:hypothetical protein CVN76_25235 [Bacillus sp. mrc49]|nr:hypothetical protein CVN76_25235 [Bacillus sp. mrc49]
MRTTPSNMNEAFRNIRDAFFLLKIESTKLDTKVVLPRKKILHKQHKSQDAQQLTLLIIFVFTQCGMKPRVRHSCGNCV